ncbi:MAG: CARDB domain-containing protein [Myxococcota bacterium]|nr:CARDB domain-containing protein [Myxococcota bacterium]
MPRPSAPGRPFLFIHSEITMTRFVPTLGLLLAFAVQLVAASAGAWEIRSCGGSNKIWPWPFQNVRTSSVSFPFGSPEEAAIEEAIDAWNAVPSLLTMVHVANDPLIGTSNDQNEVWATNSQFWLNGNPATTVVRTNCDDMLEADILYHASFSRGWTTTHNKSSTQAWDTAANDDKPRPIQATGVHELAHVAAFQHEDDEYNILGNAWTHVHVNDDTLTYYVGEDAADGAIDNYGPLAGEDVAVVNFKQTGSSSGYSTHGFVEVYSSSGATLSSYENSIGDQIYRVNAGDQVQVEFTLENNGLNSQTPRVEYVVSTNDYITTYDTYLAQRNPTLNRNGVYTTTKLVTLPSWLSSGTVYYLGAIVDPDDLIAETDEGNNASYIGIEVQ